MIHPPESVNQAIYQASCGAWVDRVVNLEVPILFGKLPMHVIRSVQTSGALTLQIALPEIDGLTIPCVGLAVTTAQRRSMYYYGTFRSQAEIVDAAELIGLPDFWVQLHAENGRPALRARGAVVGDDDLSAVLELLSGAQFLETTGRQRRAAVDLVAEAFAPEACPTDLSVRTAALPLRLQDVVPLRTVVLGSDANERREVAPSDADFGAEMERMTYLALDRVFPLGTFHSPHRKKGDRFLEICDVLAVSRNPEIDAEAVIVIQNKAADTKVSPEEMSAERFAKKIRKHISAAITQLEGAIKTLKRGEPMFSEDGEAFDEVIARIDAQADRRVHPEPDPLDMPFRASQVGHAIALITSLDIEIDWQEVLLETTYAKDRTGYFFHVLDLVELQQYLVHADGRPAKFEYILIERFKQSIEALTAGFRVRIRTE